MTTLFSTTEVCAQIAIPLPVQDPFTYSVTAEHLQRAQPGVRVRVPFKNREIVGYLVAINPTSEIEKIKPVLEVLDDQPVLSPALLAMTQWIASYYGSSWGEAIENALPQWVRYGKKAEKLLAKKKKTDAVNPPAFQEDFVLTADQTKAFQAICQALAEPTPPKPILLYGVTGSGKSEVYIRAIREVLAKNRSAICMVPEIALTEQLRRFFLHQFGDQLEILHSKLSEGDRFRAWHQLSQGEKRVVLGPRSAVFAPMQNLGLIILDEEHEGSYKQETNPRYHAREVAAWRTRNENALFLMGTATPSLETMYAAKQGRVQMLELSKRIEDRALPTVQIYDLKETAGYNKRPALLSPRLLTELETNLKKKEGSMLLLNRRGFSTHINCPRCGQIEQCTSCQVSLTYHQEDGELLCHYCNFKKPVPSVCTNCQSPLLKFAGFGTEKIESEVAARFPGARIARMDADTVRKKGSHEVILKQFRDRHIDILIGTQMIAKGFDFPHVTLVGVILADVGLMLPDFRSAERTFQLLTQVAGRAGRGKLPGRVLIQTFSPDHPSIRLARHHDYPNFFAHETQERYQYKYPPYVRLINLIVRSKNEQKAYQYAMAIRDALRADLLDPDTGFKREEVEIIGPAPLPFYRLRGHFRWHVMIKSSPELSALTDRITRAVSSVKKSALVSAALDVDPLNIL